MGFDGLFVGRIDYEDKINRQLNRNMEMLWHTGDSSSSKRDLFTTVLYNKYNAPPGFCFDITCTDDPIVDDKSSPEYNLEKKVIYFHIANFNILITTLNIISINISLKKLQ